MSRHQLKRLFNIIVIVKAIYQQHLDELASNHALVRLLLFHSLSTLFSQIGVDNDFPCFSCPLQSCFCLDGCEVGSSGARQCPYNQMNKLFSFLTRLLCSFHDFGLHIPCSFAGHCWFFSGVDSLTLSRPTPWPVTQHLLSPK